jgi:ABC-type dipeptide/oligopeptide/nickel transport system permease subunit
VWTAVPLLLGAIVVLSALRVRGVLTVALVLVVFGWPAMVRLQRASVQEAAALEYVTPARALGARPRRVLVRHVLPNAVRPLLSYASAYAGLVIGVEATLTYVGRRAPAARCCRGASCCCRPRTGCRRRRTSSCRRSRWCWS